MLRSIIDTRNCQVLYSGVVLKTSEFLGQHNERYVRVLVRGRSEGFYFLYWNDEVSFCEGPNEPRGILDLSSCVVKSPEVKLNRHSGAVHYESNKNEDYGLVYLKNVKDLQKTTGWFGMPRDCIDLQLVFKSLDEFDKFSVSVLQPLLENGNIEGKSGSSKKSKSSLKSDYKLLGELGRGAFSVVYRGVPRNGGAALALKVAKLGNLPMTERRKNLVYLNSEISIMKKISQPDRHHPNLIRMIDSFTEGELSSRDLSVVIAMEIADGGELFDRIIERDHYTETDARIIVRKLVGALDFLHKNGIVHRDLKPENMIFASKDEDAEVKITDFGLALDSRSAEGDCFRSNVVGTSGYYAPEVLSLYYGPPCDIWSMGVILYILLVGYPPFNAKNSIEMRRVITKAEYQFHYPEWEGISDGAKNLVSTMLTVDPSKRPTAQEVLRDEWLTQGIEHRAKELTEKTSVDRVSRLKLFNARRKFKAAAMAVMLGQRFNIPKHVANIKSSSPPMSFHKSAIGKIKDSLTAFEKKDIDLIKRSFERHSSTSSGENNVSKPGVVDVDMFANIMHDLGYGNLPLSRLFSLFDQNHDGVLEYNELLSGLALLEGTGEDSLRLCFQLYDSDGSGDIDPHEMGKIFRMVGYTTSNIEADVAEDLSFAFNQIDINNDGKISFDEFRTAVSTNEKLVRCFLSTRLNKGT